jgi:transcriptional regulator with XRE-family HTH domain
VRVARQSAANLLAARLAADLSQEEVGFRAEVHRTEISQLERGLRVPRIDTLAKLCGALEVEAPVLMAGIRWRPPTRTGGRFEAAGESPSPDLLEDR